MKRILLATTLMAATAFAANAASKSFNGAYLGAQAGFVKSKSKVQLTEAQATAAASKNVTINSGKNSNGLLYGLYAGYGKNLNGFYVGGEMSILSDTAKRKINIYNRTDPQGDSFGAKTEYKRGIAFGFAPRFGYVFGENLVYVKPGIEISKDKVSASGNELDNTNTNRSFTFSSNKTSTVFAPAFGYERAMGKVLLRAEYTYNLGKKVTVNDNDEAVLANGRVSYKDHRFAIGAAYKF
ncbi:MAG: outer membrane beta-barrel protein [Pseudomonadota bacterium]